MSCFGLKGGIGTASRVLEFDGVPYTMGVLVLTNFGSLEDFTICGNRVGEQISLDLASEEDKGSIIVLLGTDLPLSARQLSRVARRAAVGISRTGGLCGNGSGEIALAFSTAQYIPHESEAAVLQLSVLSEACMNQVFRAAAFATEEAIIVPCCMLRRSREGPATHAEVFWGFGPNPIKRRHNTRSASAAPILGTPNIRCCSCKPVLCRLSIALALLNRTIKIMFQFLVVLLLIEIEENGGQSRYYSRHSGYDADKYSKFATFFIRAPPEL